jgi:putative thioredoxin
MSYVIDVSEEAFQREVLEESRRRPVVVDFWASWCAPCRFLGPVLERLAEEYGGEFLLAKVDVDANPGLAAAFGVQSIPTVKAFRDGRVVSEFVGALPEATVRRWLGELLPSEADRLVRRAEELEAGVAREAEARRPAPEPGLDPRLDEAEALYRRALELEPHHRRARLGLGRVLAWRAREDEARDVLSPLRPDPDAERLLDALEVAGWARLEDRDESPVVRGKRRAASGAWEEALRALLEGVAAGGEEREEARQAMLKIFALLGEENPLTREYRRKLARLLF